MLRMPHELHDKLSRLAAEQGVSLNQLAVALLSRAPRGARTETEARRRAKPDKGGADGGHATSDRLSPPATPSADLAAGELIEDERLSVAQAAETAGVPIGRPGGWSSCTRSSSRRPRPSSTRPRGHRAPVPARGLVVLHRPPAHSDPPGRRSPTGSCASWSRAGSKTGQGTAASRPGSGSPTRRCAARSGWSPSPDGSSTGAATPASAEDDHVDAAGRVVRALGIPPCEVCGL